MLAELLSLIHTMWPGGLLGHSWISLRGSLTRKVGKAPRAGTGPGLLAGMCPGSSAARRDENWRGNRMRP